MPLSVVQQGLRVLGRQHWLRGRDRVLRLFSHPDRQQHVPFEVDFYGLPYTGFLDNFIDWTVLYYGAFVAEELQLLGALSDALRARGPVNFFDVGSNIGHHSLFMSQHADHLFCFEPFSEVRQEAQRKFQHAGVTNATLFPVAMGDRNETAQFHPPMGANKGTGTLGNYLPDNAADFTIPVEVVRGDDFFAAQQLPPISLLKMDVEGFEEQALAGMGDTLRRDRPPILLEIQNLHDPQEHRNRRDALHGLLYPDHLLFSVESSRQRYQLRPFTYRTDEVLVLPKELAGIVPGSELRS